jgi:phosphohistidine phosphatase
MKRLLLLRHAKSSRKDPSLADHDRPLTSRGEKNARRMGAYLRDEGLVPDQTLCSTAIRAVRTWESAAAELGRDVRTRRDAGLYTGDSDRLLNAVRAGAAEDDVLLLIGHNPAIQELALSLVGSGDRAELARMRRKFPTAGLAVFRFDTGDWAEIAPAHGELERFVRPGHLQS